MQSSVFDVTTSFSGMTLHGTSHEKDRESPWSLQKVVLPLLNSGHCTRLQPDVKELDLET